MRMFVMMLPAVLLATVSAATVAHAAPAAGRKAAKGSGEMSASDLDSRRQALSKLIDEQWEYNLKSSPEYASSLGDKRYNDQSSDFSAAEVARDLAVNQKFLKRFQAIDPKGFSEQELLNRELMIGQLEDSVADTKLKFWQMPVTQRSGIHLFAARLSALLSFTSAKDYDDYATRLRSFPRQIDQTIDVMKMGLASHLVPPKFLVEKIPAQIDQIISQEAEKTPFARPLAKMPDGLSDAEKDRVRKEVIDAINESVLPAYRKFGKFVTEEYAPHGRTEVGMSSLPNGKAMYAQRVRELTTTSLTPARIHEIGLSEVARIEGEMLTIAQKLGYQDLPSLNKAIESNPDLHPKSREQILEIYRKYITQMYAELPKLFGRLPKANLEVKPIEEFREKSAAGADYQPGAPDGSRPGRINVNTGDPTTRKTITMESTAYHEGVPGHHMQIAIAQELTDLPVFRKEGFYVAYGEGWALYSERLGKEVGFYQDPYNDYGRLQDEMLRAIRLVVDTGLHSKGWSRDQVVKFFHDHSAIDEVDVQSETDRYIVTPGQALGYKIGQLKITELREKARRELGDKFDIRQFHDEVLGAGALPLNLLEARIDRWIASKK